MSADIDLEEVKERVPEPAIIRGVIVSIAGLIAILTGKSFDLSWIDPALVVYSTLVPVLLSLWIRAKVSPIPKGRHAK